jgi:hypothetical protein
MKISNLIKGIYTVLNSTDSFNPDCFSTGQIESKAWLVDTLTDLQLDLGDVFLCAGWYGTLATFIFESDIKVSSIHSFDIDEECAYIAEVFNRPQVLDNWKFKASTADICTMSYPLTWTTYKRNGEAVQLTKTPNTIINTSCEHIEHFDKWFNSIPTGTYLVLQSNNLDIPEHVNKVLSLDEFVRVAPMSQYFFKGQMEINGGMYSRFMIIGRK